MSNNKPQQTAQAVADVQQTGCTAAAAALRYGLAESSVRRALAKLAHKEAHPDAHKRDVSIFPPGTRVKTPLGLLGIVMEQKRRPEELQDRVLVRYDGEGRDNCVLLQPHLLVGVVV